MKLRSLTKYYFKRGGVGRGGVGSIKPIPTPYPLLGDERVIPQVCVSLTERTTGNVIGNDIPPPENTQQFGFFSGSNQEIGRAHV